jgi:DNA-binding helix-hairpin-helix protein with protein kinase domain
VPVRTLFDQQSQPVPLGPELASGGEGVVYTLPDRPGQLAKIYRQVPDRDQVDKLRWLVREQSAELLRFAAWPTATLHDTPGGPLIGFLMPRFEDFRPIHTLYSPAHRRTAFPQADWSFLIHTAMNCCSAFDVVHDRGIVIGDVNQSNILVNRQALVALIDCDSFQVQASDRVFLCEVGVSQYTSSELQGRSLRELVRTVNHDRFGLAVLIFHLLFMGRHPFAGRFKGPGEMTLERAIEEYRFAYSSRAAASQMEPPPFALPLGSVSQELGRLFERAFDEGAEQSNGRPSAVEWHAALAAFLTQLGTCPTQPGHRVPPQLADCPWCGIIQAGGPNFFLGAGLIGGSFKVDLAVLAGIWKRVEAVQPRRLKVEQPASMVAPLRPSGLPRSYRLSRRLVPMLNKAGCSVLFLLLFGFQVLHAMGYLGAVSSWALPVLTFVGLWIVGLWGFGVFDVEKERCQKVFDQARSEYDQVAQEGGQLIRRYQKDYQRTRAELNQLRKRFESLQEEFEVECPRRNVGHDPAREAQQLEQYLQQQFLDDPQNKVPGIGPGRLATLASYGIETAHDVTEEDLEGIRGFGPRLREALLSWKEQVQDGFVYNPEVVVTDEAPSELVLKYRQLEEAIRGQLQRKVQDLEALGGQVEEQLQTVHDRLERLAGALAQAEADWRALQQG